MQLIVGAQMAPFGVQLKFPLGSANAEPRYVTAWYFGEILQDAFRTQAIFTEMSVLPRAPWALSAL